MIDTSPNITLVVLVAVLVGTGVYLLLERSLTRIIIGIALVANGINVLFLVASGRAGAPPLIAETEPTGLGTMADPLPQALVLTAIVITLGLTGFMLAMAYRSWQLNGHDEVQDDLEDRRIAQRAARDELTARATDDAGTTLAQDAALARDETAVLRGEAEHAGHGHHRPGLGADDEEIR